MSMLKAAEGRGKLISERGDYWYGGPGATSRPPTVLPIRVQTVFNAELEPSKAQQHMAKACDINNIMARYQKTGAIDHVVKYEGQYGDVPALDFREALDKVTQAQQMFADLPSSLRDRFGHDPYEFLHFVQNADQEALEVAGLVRKQEPEVVPAPPVEAAPAGREGE